MTNEIDTEAIKRQAEQALADAKRAEDTSEYPGLGKSVYTTLSQALTQQAATLEEPPTQPAADNAYEQRKAARIDRLKARAAGLTVEAARRDVRSHDIGRNIPFGQPILVGHHSERRHRNAIDKMHNASRKAYELRQAAEEAARRAEAAESSNAISSDDPKAVEKLTQKLAGLENLRDHIKAENKMGKRSPSWKLTNLGAEIRRCKQRIEELSIEIAPEQQINIEENGFKLFESAEDNRICFQFEGKPSEDVRRELKSRAFKWSPSRGLWVRQLNTNGRWAAKHTVEALRKLAAK
jgi:hypothetical protein